jgi:hypothetical protein
VDAWIEQHRPVEVPAGRVERDGHGHRLEEPEEGPQGVLQDELADERVLVDEIEEVLEHAR